MALNLYKQDDPGSLVDASNFLYSTHEAKNGSWHIQKVYLRNDSALHWYGDVRLQIVVDGLLPPLISSSGVLYQLFQGEIEPTITEWKRTPIHNELDIGDIGSTGSSDTTTYYPFWIRIYVPGDSDIGKLEEANVNIQAIEYVI